MLSWALIGSIVGLLAGLTGVGGAIVSVPLFAHLFGVDIRQATVYSLIAVFTGALLNWFLQRKETDYRISFTVGLFSYAGTFLFSGIKQNSPEWVVKLLFVALGLYSLFRFWKKPKQTSGKKSALPFWKLPFCGVILGGVTTMTGLGGGVLLMPWLKSGLGFSSTKAVPTSLLAIALISSSAFLVQSHSVLEALESSKLLALGLGMIAVSLGVRYAIQKVSSDKMDLVRKWVFSVVALGSILSVVF